MSIRFKNKKKRGRIEWMEASDIELRIKHLVATVGIEWVDITKVKCLRSENANTRAYARIWGLSRVWQLALGQKPMYVLEVISEKFDKLPQVEKDKVLLHELAHIPKNFSGSLVPHTKHGPGSFHDKLDKLIIAYKKVS